MPICGNENNAVFLKVDVPNLTLLSLAEKSEICFFEYFHVSLYVKVRLLSNTLHLFMRREYIVTDSPIKCLETIPNSNLQFLVIIMKQLRHFWPISNTIGKGTFVERYLPHSVARARQKSVYLDALIKKCFYECHI